MSSLYSPLYCQREYLGMTIKQLSKRSGISVSTIRAIETGEKKNMKISTALNLAHALYLSVDVFWFLVTKHA